ncbi:MAG: NADH-quinone oxidoreductase subunit N [Sandaracinus sp.]|nr:NADH-quinone oxidoreductase subunit N [Sandaracinus sp.]|tara:strand:- start:92 stop:1582 length:1491 start_codon:yes stop_codon:yes gene_type:complete
MNAWIAISPLLLLVVGGLLTMLVDAFSKEGKGEVATVTAATLFLAAGVSFAALLNGQDPQDVPEIFGAYLATDRLGLFFDVAIGLGGGLSALLAGGYLREHGLERGEFYILLLFSAFGAMVLARSTDMLTLFVGLETMSIGVYALAGFRRGSPRSIESALKYYLLGSFAAAILLFGAALIYAGTAHTDFAGIGAAVEGGHADVKLVLFGLLLVLVGLAFKVSAVPFHMWTPDVYEGAPTPATTFMSVVVKAAAFAVFVRVVITAFGDEMSSSSAGGWPPVLAGLAVVTMVYGNLAAIAQNSVKRMLAYSSIAHAGYILVGLAASSVVGQRAISAVLFYLMAYTVSNVLAFGSLILMGSRGREAVSFDDLAGVGRRHPLAALPFIIAVLTLMGFPPTAGFIGKYYVFSSAVEAGGGFIWLAVLGVLASAVGAYYYLRILVAMFMKDPIPGEPVAVPMRSGSVVAALVISGLAVMQMGLMPGDMLDLAVAAAEQLFAG